MRLAHSQTFSVIFLHTLLMCQIIRWGRYSEGSRREGKALTPSTSPAHLLSEMRLWWRHTPLVAVQRWSWLLLPGPCGLSLNPRSKRSTSGSAGVLAWGLPAWATAEPLFSPRSPRALHLELCLGGQQHLGAMHVLTGLRISRSHLFSLSGSTNTFAPL